MQAFRHYTLHNYLCAQVYKNAKNAEILNKFFSKPVKNLKIPEFEGASPFAEKTCHLILKAILKYSNTQYNNTRVAKYHCYQ